MHAEDMTFQLGRGTLKVPCNVLCSTKRMKYSLCKGNEVGDKQYWSQTDKIASNAKLFVRGVHIFETICRVIIKFPFLNKNVPFLLL